MLFFITTFSCCYIAGTIFCFCITRNFRQSIFFPVYAFWFHYDANRMRHERETKEINEKYRVINAQINSIRFTDDGVIAEIQKIDKGVRTDE